MGLLDSLFKKAGDVLNNSLNSAAVNVKSDINQGVNNALKKAKQKASLKRKTVKFDSLPQNAEEMRSLSVYNQKDEYAVAALTVAALLRYASDQKDGREMLDVLNGPENPSVHDLQLMDEKLIGQEYVLRSYFKGAIPTNEYTPSQPYTVEMIEYPTSRQQENYLYLYVMSGGADNPRMIQLRKKPSTGEWFIWSFQGLLMDIRVPKSEDKWA